MEITEVESNFRKWTDLLTHCSEGGITLAVFKSQAGKTKQKQLEIYFSLLILSIKTAEVSKNSFCMFWLDDRVFSILKPKIF